MKHLFLLSLLLFSLTIALPQTGILFEGSLTYQQVVEKARSEQKSIFIDIYATWCGPCKKMDKEVYNDPKVGKFYNDHFISLKVQADTSGQDDSRTKSFYEDARLILKKFNVEGFPTFLFLSPTGDLIYKEIGFRPSDEFITIGKNSLNPDKQIPFQIEEYRSGRLKGKDLLSLFYLISKTNSPLLKDSIAKAYSLFLDSLPAESVLDKNSLFFRFNNTKYVNSSSKIFSLVQKESVIIDSITDTKGWANLFLSRVIYEEEIAPKIRLYKNEHTPIDWTSIQKAISNKHTSFDAQKLILTSKASFYREREDWLNYSYIKNDLIKLYPPDSTNLDVFFQLNSPAWDIFLYCPNKKVLQDALQWSRLSIILKPESKDNFQFLDTYANILYKLGKKEEAIEYEKKAVETAQKLTPILGSGMANFITEYENNLAKMKNNQPTWKKDLKN